MSHYKSAGFVELGNSRITVCGSLFSYLRQALLICRKYALAHNIAARHTPP